MKTAKSSQTSQANYGNQHDSMQAPWSTFPQESNVLPSQRISLVSLQDYIYGNTDNTMKEHDDDSVGASPKGCSLGAHFEEALSSAYKARRTNTSADTKSPMSVIHLLASFTTSNMEQIKDIVGRAYEDALNARCGPDVDDYDMTIPPSMDTFEDDEDNRLRRLGSWNTHGTIGTLGTAATQEHSTFQQFDDDGNPINPRILQAMSQENKRMYPAKRNRLVKFDYPPVSSMRQCPRADKEDLPELFFTEQELENYEADRECTRRTDDIEIVAISKSLSDPNQPTEVEVDDIPDPSPYSPANSPRGFGSYVPTPRKFNSKRGTKFNESTSTIVDDNPAGGKAERRHYSSKMARPSPESPSPATMIHQPSHPSPRLVKSVQIFLRERSTGR